MIKQALAFFPFPRLMGVALGLFLFAYALILLREWLRGAPTRHDRLATLPLKED